MQEPYFITVVLIYLRSTVIPGSQAPKVRPNPWKMCLRFIGLGDIDMALIHWRLSWMAVLFFSSLLFYFLLFFFILVIFLLELFFERPFFEWPRFFFFPLLL